MRVRHVLAATVAVMLAASTPIAPRAEDAAAPASATIEEAFRHWQAGYLLHLHGAYDAAIERFERSIAAHPTAEGHTFLGWSLSRLGRLEEAIESCEHAIAIDPGYGNPYNDIGVYLIDLGRASEATPWFERALAAERYCCYHFAHYNLGRVHLLQGEIAAAERRFERALRIDPTYRPARDALALLREAGRPL